MDKDTFMIINSLENRLSILENKKPELRSDIELEYINEIDSLKKKINDQEELNPRLSGIFLEDVNHHGLNHYDFKIKFDDDTNTCVEIPKQLRKSSVTEFFEAIVKQFKGEK